MGEGERGDDDEHEEAANQSFIDLAGEDGELDAFELKNILDSVFKRGRPAYIVQYTGGSVAEWLACWTQALKGPGSNRSRDAVG